MCGLQHPNLGVKFHGASTSSLLRFLKPLPISLENLLFPTSTRRHHPRRAALQFQVGQRVMSLVDYPSSDDEEILEVEVREQIPNPPPQNQGVVLASSQAPERIEPQTVPPSLTLPDASLLLNSTPFSSSSLFSNRDHSSRVASALAENASRKRRSNGSSSAPSILNCNKLPRGTLRHSKNVPETVGGLLVPPQLTGRSNIVTEDVSKLFVKRHAGPESH